MRKAWARWQAWLRREAYVRAAVEAATVSAMQEGYRLGYTEAEAKMREAVANARHCALAYGELLGRQQLADELMIAHGAGEGGERTMTPDELATLKVKQLH